MSSVGKMSALKNPIFFMGIKVAYLEENKKNAGLLHCAKYEVLSTKYKVQSIFKSTIWVVTRIPYSSFNNRSSTFDIKKSIKYLVSSSKNLYKVPSTMYKDLSEVPFESAHESPLHHSSISVQRSTLKKVSSS